MGRKSKAKFELKGHTLPGINQKSEASNLKDGKSPSSAFQMQSPMKETTMPSYGGVKIDPTLSYKYKGAKIPSFRDIISLEQQQDYAKRVDERRAKRKQDKQDNTDQVETVDTTQGQENTDKVNPNEISIVTNGEVTGKTNTSSRPEGTGPVIEDPNEGGFNIDRSNSLY
tara:strand:- start:1188 stop:1697 length:510 start_codon:yes stop_codon:yes gene_type:complete